MLISFYYKSKFKENIFFLGGGGGGVGLESRISESKSTKKNLAGGDEGVEG